MIISASPTLLDVVINHPSVRPTVQQGSYRLYSADLLDKGAVAYANERGCAALFVPVGQGVYEGHIFAVDSSRGAEALRFGKLALERLFTSHGALKLVAAVPMVLPAARHYCRRLGLTPVSRDLFNEYFKTEAAKWAA